MGFLKHTLKIVVALYFAKFVSDQLIRQEYAVLIALFAGFLFMFYVSWENKFYLFTVSAFYPFYIKGSVGPIVSPLLIELIAPIFCIIMLIELILRKEHLFPKRSSVYYAAIGVILLWSVVNFINNPVFGQTWMNVSADSAKHAGIRSYFTILVGTAIFFFNLWNFRYKDLNIKRLFVIIMVLTLLIGFVRVYGYFFHMRLPFLSGTFKAGRYLSGMTILRIGGLSETAFLGITILLAMFYKRRWNKYAVFSLICFVVFLLLSGGRADFFGIIMAVLVYVTLINRKYFVPLLFMIILVAGTFSVFLSGFSLFESRIGRVAAISVESIEREKHRFASYKAFLNIIMENPVFGKGIGYIEFKGDSETESFIQKQLLRGGHGAYISIIMIFGIGGGFFIFVMLFVSIKYSYELFNKVSDLDYARLALFGFLFLIVLTVRFIPGGNGYGSMPLWYIAGMLAGLKTKEDLNYNESQ